MEENFNDIMTVEEIAQWLRIPESTVYKLCQMGEIPSFKLGKHWRFDKKIIEGWIEKKMGLEGGSAAGRRE